MDYNKKPARTCSLEGDEESVLKRQKSREIKHCENRLHPPDLSLRFRADPSSLVNMQQPETPQISRQTAPEPLDPTGTPTVTFSVNRPENVTF